MSPAKLPAMALSHHDRYKVAPPASKRLLQPRMTRIWAFLKREWQQFRGICRYLRLKRDGNRLMRSYTAVAEAMGRPIMSAPQTPQQQQRLARVHEIRAEMIAIRWAFKN